MPAERIATTVNELIVLPIQYPATPAFPRIALHYLYLRANAPRVPTDDTPREVFLVNVPVDATDMHIKSLFAQQLGGARIESIAFEDARISRGITAPVLVKKKRKRGQQDESAQQLMATAEEVGVLPSTWDRTLHQSGSSAVVTFVDKASAEMALREARRAVKNGTKIVWGQHIQHEQMPALGRARYASHHKLRFPSAAQLQASVDSYMSAWLATDAERSRELARQRSMPDEDGFVTVVRGGRDRPAREDEAKAKEAELKQREKDRVKGDFYRFQVREKRKEEAQKLISGFEDDRRRVEEIRRRKKGKIRNG